jgi:hypothetical protein
MGEHATTRSIIKSLRQVPIPDLHNGGGQARADAGCLPAGSGPAPHVHAMASASAVKRPAFGFICMERSQQLAWQKPRCLASSITSAAVTVSRPCVRAGANAGTHRPECFKLGMKASREEHLAEAETYFLRLAETAAPEGQIIRRATLAAPRQRHKAVPT